MADAEFWGLTLGLFDRRLARHEAAQRTLDIRAWAQVRCMAMIRAGTVPNPHEEFPYLSGEPEREPTVEEQDALWGGKGDGEGPRAAGQDNGL